MIRICAPALIFQTLLNTPISSSASASTTSKELIPYSVHRCSPLLHGHNRADRATTALIFWSDTHVRSRCPTPFKTFRIHYDNFLRIWIDGATPHLAWKPAWSRAQPSINFLTCLNLFFLGLTHFASSDPCPRLLRHHIIKVLPNVNRNSKYRIKCIALHFVWQALLGIISFFFSPITSPRRLLHPNRQDVASY